MTPHTPRGEDMKLEPSLDITPEGSTTDIPTVLRRESQIAEGDTMGMSSETTYMGFPNTQVKTVSEDSVLGVPKTLQGTKEASRVEVLAST